MLALDLYFLQDRWCNSQFATSFRCMALRSKKSAWLTTAETVARW
jgi:hypothetical protein